MPRARSWPPPASSTAGLDARLLAAHVFGCEIGDADRPSGAADGRARGRPAAKTLVRRRAAHEPLAYILGRAGILEPALARDSRHADPAPGHGDAGRSGAGVVPPTRGAPSRILDLGTGSGCLLLALLSELPDARGIGVDHLASGARGGERQRRTPRRRRAGSVRLRRLGAPPSRARFDLVVCNPPYIADAEWAELAADIREFEPALALRAGPTGSAPIGQVLPALPRLLRPGWLGVARDRCRDGTPKSPVWPPMPACKSLKPHVISTGGRAVCGCCRERPGR